MEHIRRRHTRAEDGRRERRVPGARAARDARPTRTRSAPVRDGLGVGIAVGLSGVAFGAAAVSAGLSLAQASALSLFAFSGASQFALIGVVGAGGNMVAGVAGAALLGGRNTLYGLRMAELLAAGGARRAAAAHEPVSFASAPHDEPCRKGDPDATPERLPRADPAAPPARRVLAAIVSRLRLACVAHGVIDETTAVATAQPDAAAARTGFTTTFAAIFVTWNLATVAGVLGANRLGDPATFGLDALVPAAFLALLWPRLHAAASDRWVAVLGAGVAVAATPFLPPGVPVLLAAAVALGSALR